MFVDNRLTFVRVDSQVRSILSRILCFVDGTLEKTWVVLVQTPLQDRGSCLWFIDICSVVLHSVDRVWR